MKRTPPALAQLEQDISERLAPVCSHMPPDQFRELVHEIALVKIKYGVQSLAGGELRGSTVDTVVVARVEKKEDSRADDAA